MRNNLGNTIPRNGLVGEWLLDGDANARVGSNGSPSNMLWVKTNKGYQNQAGSFNGTTSKITASLGQVSNFTINFIYKPNNTAIITGGTSECVLNGYQSGADNFGFINTHPSSSFYKSAYVVNTSGTYFPCQLITTPQAGKTYNISFEVNGNTLKIYIDGVLENTTTFTGTIRSNNLLSIGAINGSGNYYNGQIQSVRLYNRVLLQDEIQLLYLESLRKLGSTDIASYPALFNGLVGYWDFKGSAHNLVDGDIPVTSSGSLTTDRFNYNNSAYSFSGGTHIAFGDKDSYSFTDKICSFGAWIKTTSSAREFIISKGLASNYEWGFEINNGLLAVTLWSSAGNPIWGASTIATLNNGDWHYVSATINNNYPTLYIDGIEVSKNNTTQTSTTYTNGTSGVRIGSRSDGVGNWDGVIDEVMIFNRSLSSDEINALYKLTSQDYIYPAPSYDLSSLREGLILDLDWNGIDQSGNGNNGTLVNSPTKIKVGKQNGLSYNGSNQRVDIPHNALFNFTNAFTISFDIKKNILEAGKGILGKWENQPNAGATSQFLFETASTGKINFYVNTGTTGSLATNTNLVINKIYRVTAKYDGSNMKIFINGVLDNTLAKTGNMVITGTLQRIEIGSYSSNILDQYFNGSIFRPKIRNRALSDKEIEADYYGSKGNFIY